jgi:cell division septal protein FtsQ
LLACTAVAQAGYRAILDSPYFVLREIRVAGVSPALARDIELLVKDSIGEHPNTLALKVHEIRRRLAEHPRLRNVTVEIAYPHALVVTGVERMPVAILSAGSFYLVARDGVVIERLRPSELRRHELPYVTGISEDAVQVGQKVNSAGLMRSLEMLELLRERNPNLYSRFSEVNVAQDPVSELDNVTARLRGGMEVRFGDTNPAEKLALLDYFIEQQQKAGHDPFAMAYVDLRVPNQIVYLDKVTAAALRAGAAEPLLGSMGSPSLPSDAGELGERRSNQTTDDVVKDAAASPQKTRSATQNTKKTNQDSAKLTSAENASHQGVEQNPQPIVEQDPGPPRSSWRPRLPFRFFSRKSKQVEDAPVLLAPSDPGEQE